MKIIPGLLTALFLFPGKSAGSVEQPVLFSSTADTVTICCDSVYAEKGYYIELVRFEYESEGYDGESNSVFIVSRKINGVKKEIFRDTIFSRLQEIDFTDYNNDKIADILVQNIADVRSNLTWYLYFFDPAGGRLTRVKGFEEIKSPRYNRQNGLVENYVLSGTNWTSFYSIKKNMVIDHDIIIYDKNEAQYNRDYKKAITKVMSLKRKKR